MTDNQDATQIIDAESFQSLDRHAVQQSSADARSSLIEGIPEIYMRGAIYIFVVVVIAVGIIAYLSEVNVIVPVQGMIIPEGQNKVIEALSAGVVSEVPVKQGDRVEAGQTVLVLRQDGSGVDLRAIKDRIEIETAKRNNAAKARDIVNKIIANPALMEGGKIEDYVNAGPAMVYIASLLSAVRELRKVEKDRTKDLARQLEMGKAQIELTKAEIIRQREARQIAESTVANKKQVLLRKQEELTQTEELAERRIVPISQVNTSRDQVIQAQTSLNNQLKAISQANLSISRAEVQVSKQLIALEKIKTGHDIAIEKARIDHRRAAANLASSLSTFNQSISQLDAVIAKFKGDSKLKESAIGKLVIQSPVTGVVMTMAYTSQGQSVRRGSMVAMVVPENEVSIVVAHVPNQHVGEIKPGILAKVKVDAYPYRQFGTVPGRIISVFPVAGKPLFTVRIALDTPYIVIRGEKRLLKSGLTVKADLLTKRERILSLLFKKM